MISKILINKIQNSKVLSINKSQTAYKNEKYKATSQILPPEILKISTTVLRPLLQEYLNSHLSKRSSNLY